MKAFLALAPTNSVVSVFAGANKLNIWFPFVINTTQRTVRHNFVVGSRVDEGRSDGGGVRRVQLEQSEQRPVVSTKPFAVVWATVPSTGLILEDRKSKGNAIIIGSNQKPGHLKRYLASKKNCLIK